MTDLTRRTSLKQTAAASLAALTGMAGGLLSAQNEAPKGDAPKGEVPQAAKEQRPKDRWRAWAVTEGDDTKLVVEGIYSDGGPGVVATVKPAAPQGINPKILMLDVKKGSLPGFWTAVLTPIPAQYTVTPYRAGQYESIHVRYPDGTSIMIKNIVDAGAGPT